MPNVLAVPDACPKCSGKMWDNRNDKKNPKQPDFKCRNKACDGVVWPPRNGEIYADMVAPTPQVSPALSHNAMVVKKTNDAFAFYDQCFSHALGLATKADSAGVHISLEGVSAIAATLFISAREKGLI